MGPPLTVTPPLPIQPTSTAGPAAASPSRPFWLEALSAPLKAMRHERSTPQLPAYVPIVVVGAGMSGASCAYHLALEHHRGPDVLLLDARGISGGATGRNGGQIKPLSLWELGGVVRQHGVVTAAQLWWHEQRNRAALRAFATAHAVDCDLQRDIPCVKLFDARPAACPSPDTRSSTSADQDLDRDRGTPRSCLETDSGL